MRHAALNNRLTDAAVSPNICYVLQHQAVSHYHLATVLQQPVPGREQNLYTKTTRHTLPIDEYVSG